MQGTLNTVSYIIIYRYRHFEIKNKLYHRAIAGIYNNIIMLFKSVLYTMTTIY